MFKVGCLIEVIEFKNGFMIVPVQTIVHALAATCSACNGSGIYHSRSVAGLLCGKEAVCSNWRPRYG
jgi:hypothetical protein